MKYRKGYKYQLANNVVFQVPIYPYKAIDTEFIYLGADGLLMVNKGYAWDGCSGPTWDDRTNIKASLAHDALYQLMRQERLESHYRSIADHTMYEMCLAGGMLKLRAKYYYFAVRKFGGPSADPANKKKVYEAP